MRSVRVYLDSAIRDKQLSTPTKYVWVVKFYGTDKNIDGVTILNASDIKNICGIKTADMVIYNNGSTFIREPNVLLLVKEFFTDAYQLGDQRYHFPMYCDNTLLCRVKNKGEYWFNKIFNQMPTTLSLTFFNGWYPIPYPTNVPLYIDVNTQNINCTASISVTNTTGTITNIISNTPNAPGNPRSVYNFWNNPFTLTTQFVNSLINTATIITLTLTTDNPADAAALAVINSKTYKVKKVSFDSVGNATAEITINTSALIGKINPFTFTASCYYVWFQPTTSNVDLINANVASFIYIRNFTSNVAQYNMLVYNETVNRQSGWQYMSIGNVPAYVIMGLDPSPAQGPLSVSSIGQLDAMKLIVPLEIFYMP
jgi:hypothetical protein